VRKRRNFLRRRFYVGGICRFSSFCLFLKISLGSYSLPLRTLHHFSSPLCGVMAWRAACSFSIGNLLIAEAYRRIWIVCPFNVRSAISSLSTTTYFQKTSLYGDATQRKGASTSWIKIRGFSGFNHHYTCIRAGTLIPNSFPIQSFRDFDRFWSKISKRNISVVAWRWGTQGLSHWMIFGYYVDRENRKKISVSQLMHSPPESIWTLENMQKAMEKFEHSGAWNLPVIAGVAI